MARKENKVDRYIRERIRQAREEADLSQGDLAQRVYKNRVTISDIERGRVGISGSDLFAFAQVLNKPINYFCPPFLLVTQDDVSPIEEELLIELRQLPETQQLMALEYIRQQRQIADRVSERQQSEAIQQALLAEEE